MNVCSPQFLLAVVVGSACFFWLPSARLRQIAIAAANFAFLSTWMPDFIAWAALAALVASGFIVARLLQAYPRRSMLTAYLFLLVGTFLVFKKYDFLAVILPSNLFHHTIAVVGLSYLLFRQIHVAVDAMQGQIAQLTPWNYLNYQLNLFGLLAGPIQRFQEFMQCWDHLDPALNDSYDVLKAYLRICLGVVKVTLLAVICLQMHERLGESILGATVQQSAWRSTGKFLLWLYVYPAYVYFNFSGYCDVVIGAASLFGITMPENFDLPFLSRNMIEYWTRWHRTLGFWIRDYLFTPLYKATAERIPQHASSLAFACYFVALFVTGVWHGSTWNFVIFGILNGVGVSAAKLWENFLIKRYGRAGLRNYLQSKRIRALAVIANFHYVCLTILFFPVDMKESLRIASSYFSLLIP